MQVACQPLTVLIKNHFTSIFSISMALHCSKKPGSEKGTLVLQSSILHFGQLSEKERDKLIKRHLVSLNALQDFCLKKKIFLCAWLCVDYNSIFFQFKLLCNRSFSLCIFNMKTQVCSDESTPWKTLCYLWYWYSEENIFLIIYQK